jgi:hypothetical protein
MLKLMKSQLLKRKTKCQLYKTIILSTVVYRSESGTLSKAHETLLGGFEGKILRRIYGSIQTDWVWRKRYNKELYSLLKDDKNENKQTEMGRTCYRKIKWRNFKKNNDRKTGRKMEGRPRMRLTAGVEKDLSNLGVVNWKTKAQERDGWRKF